MHLDGAIYHVLAQYPGISTGEPAVSLGNHGGFSGARLWRVRQGTLCLRAGPSPGPTPEYLSEVHALMRRARTARLAFVPEVLPTRDGRSWVEHAGRLWEVTAWMPGEADFHRQPSRERLRAACVALARLHACWAEASPAAGPCPAVRRRLLTVRTWQDLLVRGWRPDFTEGCVDPVQPWAERAWGLVQRHLESVPAQLAPFADVPAPLHPCLCDVWHDHVLFEGEAVGGVVDYGSVKVDHPAVDLARLLGSLVGVNDKWRAVGYRGYEEVRPLSEWDRNLIGVLDWTGTVLAAANWLRWLYHENRPYEDREAVADRLAGVVQRMEWVSD
jgi:homoserine kinase type II